MRDDNDSRRSAIIKRVGKNLRLARTYREMKSREVAATLEVAESQITRWEGGKVEMGISTLLRLSEIYEVPLDALFSAEPPWQALAPRPFERAPKAHAEGVGRRTGSTLKAGPSARSARDGSTESRNK